MCLKPEYVVKNNNEDYYKLPFTLMYQSKEFSSYLQYYRKTIAASKCQDTVKVKLCDSSEFLKEVLDKDFINLIMLPLYYSSDVKGVAVPKVTVKHEIAKNDFFPTLLTNKIADAYYTGPILLPIKNAYSLYGRSMNDLCIVHKDHYVNAGLVTWVSEDDDDDDDDDDEMLLDDKQWCDTTGGTIELKMKHIATQRTLKEMMRLAGDLTAKSLTMGKLVGSVHVYGINATYASGVTLLKLSINFQESEICSLCSIDKVSMHVALNWLLHSISEPKS